MTSLQLLFSPLSYLWIQHKGKAYFDFFCPLLFALAAVVVFKCAPLPIALTGDYGLVSYVTGFVQFLSGFYITALAAVATFNRKSMDDLMDGDAPKLDGDKLTRRRYLARMFGYLAFLSIAVYLTGVCAILLEENIRLLLPDWLFLSGRWFFLFVYVFLFGNLLTTTLLGIHFLSNRILSETPQDSMENT